MPKKTSPYVGRLNRKSEPFNHFEWMLENGRDLKKLKAAEDDFKKKHYQECMGLLCEHYKIDIHADQFEKSNKLLRNLLADHVPAFSFRVKRRDTASAMSLVGSINILLQYHEEASGIDTACQMLMNDCEYSSRYSDFESMKSAYYRKIEYLRSKYDVNEMNLPNKFRDLDDEEGLIMICVMAVLSDPSLDSKRYIYKFIVESPDFVTLDQG
jgi:hypothetical protein